MDLNDQFEVEHLFFTDRECRTCGIKKSLIDSFYRIKKKHTISSSYSYECKECTVERIKENRKKRKLQVVDKWEYPDW